MKHLRNRNELLMLQSHLDQFAEQLEEERYALVSQKMKLQNDSKKMRKLIKQNQQVIKQNEMFLFSIRESLLSTVKDYENLADILHKVCIQEVDYNKAVGFLATVENKIYALQDSFHRSFGMTTYEYIERAKQTEKQN